ncbi:MAG: HAMP domain-containing sensor histidine kinase [Balneolaceae bacterium]
MNNLKNLRAISFGIGLIAVIALTVMNIYSLYELRESSIESAKENKRSHIDEFSREVSWHFNFPSREVRKFGDDGVGHFQEYYAQTGKLPTKLRKSLGTVSENRIFSEIYFTPHATDHCIDFMQPMFRYNPDTNEMDRADMVPEVVCDGIGLARSRVQTMIDELRWSNQITYDLHRSMTISLINRSDNTIFGHLNFVIDRDYLVNEYFPEKLEDKFGEADESGIVVWLIDDVFTNIIGSSDPTYDFNWREIDIRQRFPDLPENWILYAKFIDSPTIAASNASWIRNLLVLGTAVFALFGALIFMYITSKRERELAQRQAGFLANVTHELKTPLAAMQAAGENISDGRVTDGNRLKTYGNHIYNESIRLRKMIDKLLDIARFDAGTSNTIQRAPQKLDEMARQFFRDHYNYVTSKGFRFTLASDTNIPLAMVDSDHIETILSNLVENALKYSTDTKEIHIGIRQKDNHVSLHVRDRGVGIPKRAQKQIFEKFYRIEDTLTARTKGHGLGLSIVQNLVTLNGGRIDVESKPGQGSTFIVSFPVFLESTQTDKKSESTPRKKSRKMTGESEYAE